MKQKTPQIDSQRLWESLEDMACIGALPSGGCRRLSLSDEDQAARDVFAEWCREAGCKMHVDGFGNQFAVRTGRVPNAPLVLFGSHLDTQPNGGRFDGIYGVLAGLEVMRTLAVNGVETDRSLAVVNWTNEEGVRFSPGLTGSKGFAGAISDEELGALRTPEGASFLSELERIGYLGKPPPFKVASYFEAHIEQGPILEAAELSVGVVNGVQGVRWFEVVVTGADRHAGTTPMSMRADSYMGAARIALAVRERLLALTPDIRVTVGRVDVKPGSVNTVPGETTFSIDLRHPSTEILDEAEALIKALATQEATAEACVVRTVRTFNLPPVRFNAGCVELVASMAQAASLPTIEMVSGAMHDACALSTVAPTAMIFTACRGGISHSEEEFAEPEDLAAGCQLLLDTVLSAARIV